MKIAMDLAIVVDEFGDTKLNMTSQTVYVFMHC